MDNVTARNTIPSMVVDAVRQYRDTAALHVRRDGRYQAITWQELAADIRRMADLLGRNVKPGDRVAQVAENRYEWIVTDLAILHVGAVHVSIHATLSGPQIAYQIRHSGAKWLLVSGRQQAEQLQPHADDLAQCRCVAYDDWPDRGAARPQWELLAALLPANKDEGLLDDVSSRVRPDDLAAILYTSGTTGDPKGVMLTHENLASNASAVSDAYGPTREDLRICSLPLSHIYARTCDLYSWVYSATQLALAESRETVLEDCREIRPTMLNSVPYFYDKLCRHLYAAGHLESPGALRELLGGRVRVCFSGGAPLPDEVARMFERQDVTMLQGYGLTEASPVISFCRKDDQRIGTVGPPVPGVEVRIAQDGEILTRGPHVMRGYWRDPEATAEVIRDGWLHTGDLGSFDSEGRLIIDGRKKELIVTATGKNIAPTHLEGLISASSLVAQVMVVGDNRKYLAALVVPDWENVQVEVAAGKLPSVSSREMITNPDVRARFRQEIDARLSGLSRHEQIGRFALLKRGFEIERGELTAKLSLRREVIQDNFGNTIETLYRQEADSPAR